MTNRAQRRAQERNKSNVPEGGNEPQRSTSSQATFEHKADVAATANSSKEWQPHRVDANGNAVKDADISSPADASKGRKRTARGWWKVASWVLIVVSAIAFMVVMWIPNLPLWVIATVSGIFVVGVFSLFIVRSGRDVNPYVDANGTAV